MRYFLQNKKESENSLKCGDNAPLMLQSSQPPMISTLITTLASAVLRAAAAMTIGLTFELFSCHFVILPG